MEGGDRRAQPAQPMAFVLGTRAAIPTPARRAPSLPARAGCSVSSCGSTRSSHGRTGTSGISCATFGSPTAVSMTGATPASNHQDTLPCPALAKPAGTKPQVGRGGEFWRQNGRGEQRL